MRKLWLLGIAAVLVLALGPLLVAYAAQEPKQKRVESAKGDQIILTPAQEEALGAEVMNVRDSIEKLYVKAETVLKDRDQARRFVVQTVMKEMRAASPEPAKHENRGRKGDKEK